MLDMGGLAHHAFDQQYLFHRPADRRDLLRGQAIAVIVDRDVRLRRGAEGDRGAASSTSSNPSLPT